MAHNRSNKVSKPSKVNSAETSPPPDDLTAFLDCLPADIRQVFGRAD